MALEIIRLNEGAKAMEMYTVTERLCLTEDDRLVPEGDVDGRWLYATPGQEVPLAEAVKYGLVEGDAVSDDAAAKEADEAGKADENAGASSESDDAAAKEAEKPSDKSKAPARNKAAQSE